MNYSAHAFWSGVFWFPQSLFIPQMDFLAPWRILRSRGWMHFRKVSHKKKLDWAQAEKSHQSDEKTISLGKAIFTSQSLGSIQCTAVNGNSKIKWSTNTFWQELLKLRWSPVSVSSHLIIIREIEKNNPSRPIERSSCLTVVLHSLNSIQGVQIRL